MKNLRPTKKRKKKQDIRYLECTKHGKKKRLPWSIVCTHLLDGPPQYWHAIPQEGKPKVPGYGVLDDYVCDACYRDWDRIMDEQDLTHVRPCCVECTETIRFILDTNHPSNRK